ncbi:tyrosine 3-monooxygenase/tryptophan 5-monooxygenase activation protein [Saprolegnia diclina VS20]|uniref:Tyrosine 3-monooxygenase/tryptophan 5-monooxygenase activation protein n=1 Tax=Saprolegnia diclina (strain VS20) TaxID=1156394 RepID=T0RAM5_SAPDV|nr:tyrosine 3-monooxygenase/tryptophan 5-monooxygenase activation protein [Saprolegnia diclina VS20]EQC29238.1 tyrosine 3-monooxygenase/tryptophan 5-monooxygenase activation protein [Saprolegnia diclina VS20]|eukprot:XP_008617416.1 tyrosine 3-monooxygenase/tryptophan 5-monooxygenase activation protein [Saprolegnia diclina VS20]
MPASLDRSSLVFLAQLAEQAERYDEMADYMKTVVTSDPTPLDLEERNLLAVAYKNVIGSRRAAWRVLQAIETHRKSERVEHVQKYRLKIEAELQATCDEMLEMLNKQLLPSASSPEDSVFYLKTQGDYYRYLAEFQSKEQGACEKALACYGQATDIATSKLHSTNPLRLGLALNFAVFYCEIMKLPDRACQLAKQAFDDAIADMDSLTEESFRDAAMILQIIRDNLTLWTSEEDDDHHP